MDHIPVPEGTTISPFRVPLVASYPYDFLGFETFPERLGFVVHGRTDADRCGPELSSLLQSWLYFGLLSDFLGRPVAPRTFQAQGEGGSRTLNSAILPTYLDEWQLKLRALGAIQADQEIDKLKILLEQAVRASLVLDYCQNDDQDFALIALSVKLLISTLMDAYNSLSPTVQFVWTLEGLVPVRVLENGRKSPAARLLMNTMVALGWCPQAALRVCSCYTYNTVFYLLHLPRLRQVSHARCTQRLCVAYNIEKTTYKTVHTVDDCQCEHITVDMNQLIDIIQTGDVPLIRLTASEAGDVEVSLTKSGYQRSYCSISHVWCDGLGNPYDNSLPRCQLRRLHSILKQKNISYLWMDTLCIPVGEAYKAYKRMAIGSMASIYSNSNRIIVMDKEVRQACDDPTLSDAMLPRRGNNAAANSKFLAYIMCSVWNCRCWCYQEAVLGHNYLFDTPLGLLAPPMRDVKFYPGLSNEHPAARWALWRTLQRPGHYLLFALRLFSGWLSLRDMFTFMPRVVCAPQAWKRCQRAVGQLPQNPTRCAFALLTGSLWLLVVLALTLLSLPGALFLTLWGLANLALVPSCFYVFMYCVAGTTPMESKAMLEHQTRLRIATELINELQPPHIDQSKELQQPDQAARMRAAQFAQAWNALAWRTVTETEDVHPILASLVDMAAYRIRGELASPVERMRAIASSYKELPLSLLFSPSTVEECLRDPLNPWLPIAPAGDLLRTDAEAETLAIHANEVRVHLQPGRRAFLALRVNASTFDAGDAIIARNWSGYEFRTREGEKTKKDECYLVELPLAGELSRDRYLLRGARLNIGRIDGQFVHCSYGAPVKVEARQDSIANDEETERLVSSFHAGMTLVLPFNKGNSTKETYRLPVGVYRVTFVLTVAWLMLALGSIFLIAILGFKVSHLAFYIGYPVMLAICVALCATAGRYLVRLQHSGYDKRLASHGQTWFAHVLKAWWRNVAINFAPRDGKPQRWYHVLSDDSTSSMRNFL